MNKKVSIGVTLALIIISVALTVSITTVDVYKRQGLHAEGRSMDGVPSLCEGLKEQVNRNDRRKREIMETWQYCAPCLMGVEGIVGDELKRMDAGEVRVENGRVLFSGGPELLARANIGLRCACLLYTSRCV